jgi:hypothetical protein
LIAACFDSAGPPDFYREVMPRLTRLGCNSGACHGAAAGRGHLKLSLLGSDPRADYRSLVAEFEGRRVNLHHPQQSLLLRKATGEIDHGGGTRFDREDIDGQVLLRWLQAGAPLGEPPQTISLRSQPSSPMLLAANQPLAVRWLAEFDEANASDVTDLVTLTALDPSALTFDSQQRLVATRPGQFTLLARYLDQVEALTVLVPEAAVSAPGPIPDLDNRPIDHFISRQLAELGIAAVPAAADSVWLRRVTLDLTGRLPTPEVVQAFLADTTPDRRRQYVDQLCESEDFANYWTWRWAQALQLRALPQESPAHAVYASWLREQIQADRPWHLTVRDLLLALGDSHKVGPANFHRLVPNARSEAELVGRIFAGIHIECANCHDHPLDRWKMADYHGFAAIFAPIERGRVVQLNLKQRVTHPLDGEVQWPQLPGGQHLAIGEDHRLAVWQWLVAADQPRLARATVNRLWHAMMGRGLVEPVDDIRATNPASHPELMEWLTNDFIQHEYRWQHTLKQIALSDAYGRQSSDVGGAAGTLQFYASRYPRVMPPEIYLDAIADVLAVESVVIEGQSQRAVQWVDFASSSPELDGIGRCRLNGNCDVMATRDLGLAAQLQLLNGSVINRRLAAADNRIGQWLAEELSTADVVEKTYGLCLGRAPTPAEWSHWQSQLAAESPALRRELWQDFFWAMLTSREFREIR